MSEFISISAICRNEEASLHDFFEGMEEYLEYPEADIIICDTGSTDNSLDIVREYEGKYPGKVKLVEAGERFKYKVTQEEYDEWIKGYGFEPSFEVGKGYFHFADARNYASKFTKHDFNFACDIDERPEWDLAELLKALPGADHLNYQFIYAHNPDGSPGLQFQHSKIYRKSKMHWINQVHEVEANLPDVDVRPPVYTSSLIHHHYQKTKESRGNYLPGLELSVLHEENLDRNLFYLAREYFYKGVWGVSIKMFEVALRVMWWKPERGQAYIFKAKCHEMLGQQEIALENLHMSLMACDTRREPFFELGEYYSKCNKLDQAVSYYLAALGVPYRPHGYLNSMELYGWLIHDRLATLYAKIGAKDLAKEQWLKCLKFDDVDKRVLSNITYFYETPKISIVVPTCRPEGFIRLQKSIEENTFYPNWEIIKMDGEGTAVEKFNEGVNCATGDLIVFMADDTEATLGWLIRAFVCLQEHLNGRGAVIFNDGHWEGTIAGHFLASKDLKDDLGGELWHSGYKHNGVDVEMFCRLTAKKQIIYEPIAKIIHHHYYSATEGATKDKRDKWSDKVLEWALKDRRLLIRRLYELGLESDAKRYEEWFREYYPGISLVEE